MELTSVQIRIMNRHDYGPLKAYASITLDNKLAIHEIKILEIKQRLFLAMPSRPLSIRCPACHGKNLWLERVAFCGDCGQPLPDELAPSVAGKRDSPYIDICHPITQDFRSFLESKILGAYWDERCRFEKQKALEA